MKNLFSCAILIWLISSCDTVKYKDAKVAPTVIPAATDTLNGIDFEQKIFLEDYTGHTCGNCPFAADEVKKLVAQYGTRVVVMAIHVGNFALPSLNPNKPSYKEDYRTSVGNNLDDKFKASDGGLPKGTINRKRFTASQAVSILNFTEWGTRISQNLALPGNGVGIKIEPALNRATRVIDLKSKVFFKSGFNGNLKMAVYLVEDKIISWQKYYPTPSVTIDSARYEHNHMLRAGLAPKNGNYLLSAANVFLANQSYETEWQGIVPEAALAENSKIIFVLTNADTEEVIQVTQEDLIAK